MKNGSTKPFEGSFINRPIFIGIFLQSEKPLNQAIHSVL